MMTGWLVLLCAVTIVTLVAFGRRQLSSAKKMVVAAPAGHTTRPTTAPTTPVTPTHPAVKWVKSHWAAALLTVGGALLLLFVAASVIMGLRTPGTMVSAPKRVVPAKLSITCTTESPCALEVGADGWTEMVDIPRGYLVCFDDPFWTNLEYLGYTVVTRDGREHTFSCSEEQVVAGSCRLASGIGFRFHPEEGFEVPSYRFVPLTKGHSCSV